MMNYKKLRWLPAALIIAVALWANTVQADRLMLQAQSAACSLNYTVQTGDSLGKIADKYYGDVQAFPIIFNATNLAAEENSQYVKLADPNIIEAGQILCVPGGEDAQAFQNIPAAQVAPQNPAPSAGGDQLIGFSHQASLTGQPFQLTLTPLAAGTIHYTTNGSAPNADSPPYQGPIPINEPTIIRAQVFGADGAPAGVVQTKSYLFANYNPTIPVISIAMDWGEFDTLHAAARERGPEWERPINMEYFAPGGQLGFEISAGIRIHGNFSRLFNPKKSYRIYFRKDYGADNLEYPLFAGGPVTTFDKLVLRAIFQDAFTHRGIPERADRHEMAKYISDQVARDLHLSMGQPAPRGDWVLLYFNGQFWGLYNLTEHIDQQFLASYSGDPDGVWHVIAKESGWNELGEWYSREEVKEGDYGAWLDNQDFVGNAEFSDPSNIGRLENNVDLENIFSYMFLQAYIQNTDWPGANWIVYRRIDPNARGSEAKWRMMVWDAEDSFGTTGSGFKTDLNSVINVHSPHDSITRILEKPFIKDCRLKLNFVQRAKEYLGVENTNNRPAHEVGQLSKERIRAEVLRQAETIRPFMPLEIARWAPDLSVDLWERNIQNTLRFVDEREEVILHHLDILRDHTFMECR